MKVLETERLQLRWLTTDDALFIIGLLNDPSFLRFIGDKGVRTLEDARRFIVDGPMKSYQTNRFGLNLVELKPDRTPIGICGLVMRDTLPEPDIGFAFLPAYWNRGYACEAVQAVMDHARHGLGMDRVLAITTPDNHASAKLLGKIGFHFERMLKLTQDAPEVKLFCASLREV